MRSSRAPGAVFASCILHAARVQACGGQAEGVYTVLKMKEGSPTGSRGMNSQKEMTVLQFTKFRQASARTESADSENGQGRVSVIWKS